MVEVGKITNEFFINLNYKHFRKINSALLVRDIQLNQQKQQKFKKCFL